MGRKGLERELSALKERVFEIETLLGRPKANIKAVNHKVGYYKMKIREAISNRKHWISAREKQITCLQQLEVDLENMAPTFKDETDVRQFFTRNLGGCHMRPDEY